MFYNGYFKSANRERYFVVNVVGEYHEMSLPLYESQCSFDELLFVLGLCEAESGTVSKEEQY